MISSKISASVTNYVTCEQMRHAISLIATFFCSHLKSGGLLAKEKYPTKSRMIIVVVDENYSHTFILGRIIIPNV